MEHLVKRWRERYSTFENEDGFTLVELMIVIVVIGILTAVAIPAYFGQQRAAIDATVQHDVKSNSTVMAPGTAGKAYMDKPKFLSGAAETSENVTNYFVKNDYSEACTETKREFSESDVTYWHFLTTDGYIKQGPCPLFDDTPINPGNPDPENPEGPGDGGVTETPETDDLTQQGGLKFRTSYAPQTNHLTFCWRLWINIDTEYPHTTENPSVPWEYKIDLNKAPFWGLNPNTDLHSEFSYSTKSLENGIWTIKGEGWNNEVTLSDERYVGFCSSSVPEPPLDTSIYTYTVETVPSSSNWWACIQFKIRTDSMYPMPWKIRVDLTDYFRSLDSAAGRAPTFELFTAERVGSTGYIYDLTGIGWNNYVADYENFQRDIGNHRVCYGPQGQPF